MNTAADSGGIYNGDSTIAAFINSTVSGNTAYLYFGGIYNNNSSATFTNSTVSGNITNWWDGSSWKGGGKAVTDWSHLIAAGGSAECYSYLDASATPAGTTYFYLLEDVNMGGYRTFHWGNIVSATVCQDSGGNPQCEDE